MVQKYSEKGDIFKEEREKTKTKRTQTVVMYVESSHIDSCVWLSGRMHNEERLNEGPRLQRKQKDENETKENICGIEYAYLHRVSLY